MLEKDLEKYFVNQVKNAGGLVYKFVSPGHSGVPDRLIIMPSGRAFFAELKAPGGKLRPLQDKEISRLVHHGINVYLLDSKEQVDELMHDEKIDAEYFDFVPPIPCTQRIHEFIIKDWLLKIHEELDEFEEALFQDTENYSLHRIARALQFTNEVSKEHVAEEAADIITTVTSFCQAIGIEIKDRNKAQHYVNTCNKERNRW